MNQQAFEQQVPPIDQAALDNLLNQPAEEEKFPDVIDSRQ